MSRSLPSEITEALDDPVFTPMFAVELDFQSGETVVQSGSFIVGGTYTIVSVGTTDFTLIGAVNNNVGTSFSATGIGTGTGTASRSNVLRLWTGFGDLNFNGFTWTGSGTLLSISSIGETTDIVAKGAILTLSSVPSEVISLAIGVPYQGRPCKIYFGVSESSMTEIFSGYMDQMNIQESSDMSVVELTVENKLVDLERSRVARYTTAYQKSKYPNDNGLSFVEDLQDRQISWGSKATISLFNEVKPFMLKL